ncbi:MAG: carboxypeptidase regulatory-like domain-containing protein, partial [Desulfobacterales bacterium]|nr:carboxypeptidase regulatory-like domain-containing protein [Desulfobacterales bacterium]
GLVAYYPFNGNANDASGNANNGTVSGATLTVDRNGNANSAYSFSGYPNYISLPNLPISGSTPRTISTWGYFTNGSYQNQVLFISGRTNIEEGFAIVFNANKQNDIRIYFNNNDYSKVSVVNINKWHHIVAIYYGGTLSQSTVQLYIDGIKQELQKDGGGTGSANTYNGNYRLGGGETSNQLYGLIDDVRVYNRALSESEIQQLYTESTTSTTLTISGKVTDANGNGISGETVTMSGDATDSKTTDASGNYSFSGLNPGYYKIYPPEDGTYYSYYINDNTKVLHCHRYVEIVNGSQSVTEVNFTKNISLPFVKLLFPRSGDKLSGDFGIFGTAFRQFDCTTCASIDALQILINGSPMFYGTLLGSSSDRFALSQVIWRDSSNTPVSIKWEDFLTAGQYVTFQVAARNTNGVWGYSEKISIAGASTTSTVSIVKQDFDSPLVPSSTPRTLSYETSTTVTNPRWYTFKMDYPDDPTTRLEYDSRESTETTLNNQIYSIEDVYPVCIAAVDASGNTLVDIENIVTYKPARFGHPEANGSGSRMAAYGANVVSGNFYYQTEDFSLEGVGLPVSFARRYNSLGSGEYSIFGYGGWNHSYHYGIFLDKAGRRLYLVMPDGHWERFAYVDGTWQTMVPGAFWVVQENSQSQTFSAWDKQNVRYDFTRVKDNWWYVSTITDSNGNTLSFTYSSDKLTHINDTRNRTITFNYEGGAYVRSITDGTGRSVFYDYDINGRLSTFRDRIGNVWDYGYSDFSGKTLLATIEDPMNNVILTNTFNSSGKIITQKDGLNNTWTIDYTSDTLTTVTNPLGVKNPLEHSIKYTIDANKRMVTYIEDPLANKQSVAYKSNVTASAIQEMSLPETEVSPKLINSGKAASTYQYSSAKTGNVTKITDALDRETVPTWIESRTNQNKNWIDTVQPPGVTGKFDFDQDTKGNITKLTNPLTQPTQFTYTTKGQINTVVDALTRTTTHTYTNNQLTQTTDAKGNNLVYTYDETGRVSKVKDKRGNFTSYTYNDNDQVTEISDPLGNVIQNTYDASGNLTMVTDKRGNKTTYTYNAANQVETVKQTVGTTTYTTTYHYDGLQRVWKVTNARSYDTHSTFDSAGRVTHAYNALEQYIEYTYDANGNVTKTVYKDADGTVLKTVSNTYDLLDRVTAVQVTLGTSSLTTSYTYNSKGLVETMTNPNNQITTYGYDDMGKLTSVTDSNLKITKAEYDSVGNLKKVIDPLGNKTEYEYDSLNRLILKKDHENNIWEFDYDENDNLISYKDPKNQITTYTYDKLNRKTEIRYPDGSTVAFTYDANGNLTSMTDAHGLTTQTYDELNRLISRTDCYGKTVSYTYDQVSNIASIVYPNNKTVSYTYDKADRMQSVSDWLNHSTNYSYNALSQIVSVLHGNNTRVDIGYDSAGRLTNYTNSNSSGNQIASYAFTLDANGNRTSASITEPLTPQFSSAAQSFTHNTLNQIISGHQWKSHTGNPQWVNVGLCV